MVTQPDPSEPDPSEPDPSEPDLGPGQPITTLDAYFARWQQLHDGVDPSSSTLIRIWLTVSFRIGRILVAMRLGPNAVTVLGLVLAICVPLVAWSFELSGSAWWLWLSVVLVTIAGIFDNLDGAVAVITGRTTRWGFVLDSTCDRLSEAAFFSALWVVGAPPVLVCAAFFFGFLQEYIRARSHVADSPLQLPLTISERPTRVAIVAVFLGLAAWSPYGWNAEQWSTLGAAIAAVVGLIGVSHLTWAVWRNLR